jgi:competence protein ComEA
MPEQLRLGRLAVSTSAVVALLALVLAVGCAFVVRILWAERSAVPQALEARPRAAPTAGLTVTGGATGPGAGATAGHGPGASSAASEGSEAQVVVRVVGEVRKPGLVRLAVGARVADALTAAGGATKRADLAALNLARPVSDGEQVYVPRPGETPPGPSGEGKDGGAGAGTGQGAAGSGAGPVNLNTADLAALDSLPGVGPVLAQRILDWRAEHGRFSSVEELGEVSGIGDKLLAQLKPKVTL